MRDIELLRDGHNRIYAEDSHTGERYYFLDYVNAISATPALQEIVAVEMLEDLADYARFVAGENPVVDLRVMSRFEDIDEGVSVQ